MNARTANIFQLSYKWKTNYHDNNYNTNHQPEITQMKLLLVIPPDNGHESMSARTADLKTNFPSSQIHINQLPR
jgi:hypothetical protein